MIRICIFDNPAAVAQAAAKFISERLQNHEAALQYTLALSGGSTPRLMYKRLRQLPRMAALINERGEIFFSDERAVPLDNVESNYHTASVELLQPLGIDERKVHPFRGDSTDPRAEATRYEMALIKQVARGPGGIPALDLILLGMGADGHTASLFPELDFASLGSSLIAAPYVQSLQSYRFTFTLRLINQARTVLFMATGAEKASALKNVLSGDSSPNILPAGRVEAAETIWMIDAAAASELSTRRLRGTIERC